MFWKYFANIRLPLPDAIALGFVLLTWIAFFALLMTLPIALLLKVFF